MRTLVLAPSGARVLFDSSVYRAAQLGIGVHSSGIKLLRQSGTNDLDQRGASRGPTARTARANHQDRFTTALLKLGDCFS